MHPIVRFGRWTAELYQRAVHLIREPDPNCPDCFGRQGSWAVVKGRFTADWDECACLDQLRAWRLPLWPRSQRTETEPF